jgi:hypothetical protein
MSALPEFSRVVMLWICLTSTVAAQENWAEGLLSPRSLDFGTIATGSESVKWVTVKNNLQVSVELSGVSTACQCAQATMPSKRLLQPGEETAIEVRMNTLSFQKLRETTLTVTFGSPGFVSVSIPIRAYIRTDVVFEPGKLDFGNVEYSKGAEQVLKIMYAGRADWTIEDVKCAHPDMKCELREISRNAQAVNGINVEYSLRFRLSGEAKVGRFLEYATLETDDAKSPRIPLIVQGVVVPDVSISNPHTEVRALRVGQSAVVRLVIRGTRPFAIAGADFGGLAESFVMLPNDKVGGDEKLRIVELKFTAPNRPGRFSEVMRLRVEGREEPLEFSVSGTILN